LYNKVFATTLLDRLTHRCDIAYATQLGNQVTGAPFSTVIGSSWRVAVRRPAGGNRDNLTGVGPVVADRNRQLSGSPVNIIVDLWQAVH